MMDTLNKWQYTLIVFLAFACLATYSYGEHGYDQAEVDRVGEIATAETDWLTQLSEAK